MAHAAAMQGDVLALEAWLSSHNDCNAISEPLQSRSLLHCAAYSGSVPCVEALLRYKSLDLNRKDRTGLTPLHCACFKDRREVVKLLLDAGADVNASDNESSTGLQKACREGYKEVVEIILKKTREVKEKMEAMEAAGQEEKEMKATKEKMSSSIVDINAKDTNGLTALHIATERGHAAIVQELVRNGANANEQDNDGQTPLHVATYHLHPKTVRYLLKKAASPDLADVEGATPLHLAAWIGNEELVKMLAEAMLHPTSPDLDGQTALSISAEQGNLSCVKALLSHDDLLTAEYEKRLRLFSQTLDDTSPSSHDHISTSSKLKIPRKEGESMHAEGEIQGQNESHSSSSPIPSSSSPRSPRSPRSASNNATQSSPRKIKIGGDQGRKELGGISPRTSPRSTSPRISIPSSPPTFPALHIDMFPDVHGETPLHKAALCNRYEVLEVILKKFALLNARRAAAPFTELSSQSSSTTTTTTKERSMSQSSTGAAKTTNQQTKAPSSSSSSSSSSSKFYDVDVKDGRSATPLLSASFNGHPKCVSLLLEYGAEVNSQDEEGASALHKAAFNGHLDVLEILIAKQSDIDMVDGSGATPLHKAAFNGQTGAVVLLCKVGARVDACDSQGGSALHNAAYGGHLESVEALMKFMYAAGRDVSATDSDGFNALHMAASQGHDHIVHALLRHKDSPFHVDAPTSAGWTPLVLALKQQHPSTALLLARLGASFILDKPLARRLRNVPQPLLVQIQNEVALQQAAGGPAGSSSIGGASSSSSSASSRRASTSSSSAPHPSSRKMSISAASPSPNAANASSSDYRAKHSYGLPPAHSISYAHLSYTTVASNASSSSKGRRKTDRGQSVSGPSSSTTPSNANASSNSGVSTSSSASTHTSASGGNAPFLHHSSHYSGSGGGSQTSLMPSNVQDGKKSKRKSSRKQKKSKGGDGEQNSETEDSSSFAHSDYEASSSYSSYSQKQGNSSARGKIDYATDSGMSGERSGSPTTSIPYSRKARRASSSADPVLSAQASHSTRRRTESIAVDREGNVIGGTNQNQNQNQNQASGYSSNPSNPSNPSNSSLTSSNPGSSRKRGETWTSPALPQSGHMSSYELSRNSVNKTSNSSTVVTPLALGGNIGGGNVGPSGSGSGSGRAKSFRRQQDAAEVLQAVELFKRNPGDAIELLIEAEVLQDNCTSVAAWLYEREDIDRPSLGLFLSRDKNWNTAILESFVDLFDFDGMEFDSALRKYLSKFRLPGEAQKIDRLMEKFAIRYYAQNSKKLWEPVSTNIKNMSSGEATIISDSQSPVLFADKDSIYVLAFSVIMLNTDAHNPAIKKANKMTKAQFIRNVSGINGGHDFPSPFLSDLYDKIVNYEIKMDTAEVIEEFDVISPRVGGGGGSSSNSTNASSPSSTPASEEFSTAALKGYLMKQGGKVKSWKKRWFVLDGNCLFYFNSSSDKDPLGIIPLENLTVTSILPSSSTSKRRYTFMLQNPNEGPIKATVRKGSQMVVGNHEQYLFQAASEQELSLWVESLNRNIFRNPFYLLLANKKKQMESKGRASSPAQAAQAAQAKSQAAKAAAAASQASSKPSSTKLTSSSGGGGGGGGGGGSSSSIVIVSHSSSSPRETSSAFSTPSRKGKNSSSSSIQRTDSIFSKVSSSPPDSPLLPRSSPSLDPKPDPSPSLAPSSSKVKHSSSTRRGSLTVTPRTDDK